MLTSCETNHLQNDSAGDVAQCGVAKCNEIGRRELDLETASTGANEYARVQLQSRISEGRETAPLSEWADPANDVSGRALGFERRRHLGTFCTREARQRLQIELGRDRYQRDGETSVVELCDQCLVHAPRIGTERGSNRIAIAERGIALHLDHAVLDARAARCVDCWRHLAITGVV